MMIAYCQLCFIGLKKTWEAGPKVFPFIFLSIVTSTENLSPFKALPKSDRSILPGGIGVR